MSIAPFLSKKDTIKASVHILILRKKNVISDIESKNEAKKDVIRRLTMSTVNNLFDKQTTSNELSDQLIKNFKLQTNYHLEWLTNSLATLSKFEHKLVNTSDLFDQQYIQKIIDNIEKKIINFSSSSDDFNFFSEEDDLMMNSNDEFMVKHSLLFYLRFKFLFFFQIKLLFK